MKISEILAEKLNGQWKRQIVPVSFYKEAIKRPDFHNSVVGSGSIANPRHQCVYVFQGNEFQGKPITAPAIARSAIEKSLEAVGRKRYPYEPEFMEESPIAHPLYFEPFTGKALYLDMVSAFYQIYTKMPLVCGLRRGKLQISPPWFYDLLPEDIGEYKLVRNAIPGIWRGCSTTRIKDGTLRKEWNYLPSSNFTNWHWLQSVLHFFASFAVECGAKYVYSDGYIFPSLSQWTTFIKFCRAHGFEVKIKHRGMCQIWGLGRYKIGEVMTKATGQSKPTDTIIRNEQIARDLLNLQKFNPYYWRSYEVIQSHSRREPKSQTLPRKAS